MESNCGHEAKLLVEQWYRDLAQSCRSEADAGMHLRILDAPHLALSVFLELAVSPIDLDRARAVQVLATITMIQPEFVERGFEVLRDDESSLVREACDRSAATLIGVSRRAIELKDRRPEAG